MTELISRQEQRSALRKQQRREQVQAVTTSRPENRRVIRVAFHTMISAEVVVVAIPIALAIRLIVFMLVADKIG